MVTTQEIESIGFKHVGSSKNGGSKLFTDETKTIILKSNADNFILKNKEDKELEEIIISKIENIEFKTIYKGYPKNLKSLKKILEKIK